MRRQRERQRQRQKERKRETERDKMLYKRGREKVRKYFQLA